MPKSKPSFYAVARGRQTGIFTSWDIAKKHVEGFSGARYKSFKSRVEANSFLSSGGIPPVANAQAKASRPSRAPVVTKSTKSYDRQVYCDGACPKNGRNSEHSGVGIAWFRGVEAEDISERVPESSDGTAHTNNSAELFAIIRVLESDPEPTKPLEILTDSQYSIQELTVFWMSQERRGWQTATGEPVKNVELIKCALGLMQLHPGKIKFTHVRGHKGIEGNTRADALAVRGARLPTVPAVDFKQRLANARNRSTSAGLEEDVTFEVEYDIDESMLASEEELRAEIENL